MPRRPKSRIIRDGLAVDYNKKIGFPTFYRTDNKDMLLSSFYFEKVGEKVIGVRDRWANKSRKLRIRRK